jgi:hypothetical protein
MGVGGEVYLIKTLKLHSGTRTSDSEDPENNTKFGVLVYQLKGPNVRADPHTTTPLPEFAWASYEKLAWK